MARRSIAELDQAGIEHAELFAILGLRFDRVVVDLLAGVRRNVEASIPDTHWVLFTTTAPIRKPSKVEAFIVAAVQEQLRQQGGPVELKAEYEGNAVRVRLLPDRPHRAPKVLGFVHNPSPRAGEFLDTVRKTCESAGA